MSVGVTKDYKLKQRNLRASHTLEFTRLPYTENKRTFSSFFVFQKNLFFLTLFA